MRKIHQGIFCMLILCVIFQQSIAQDKVMSWTTKSDKARELASKGLGYFLNIERPQAYLCFKEAVELDPDFSIAYFFLSNLSYGKTRFEYIDKANKSVADKTDGEKLFISILDTSLNGEKRRGIWAKLHDMFPDGRMLHYYYAMTRATPEERIAVMEEFAKKYPDLAPPHNMLGYWYMIEKKDNAMAKKHFEKYIELYQDGYNPFDSMGEFYLTTGDTTNARKYYRMALERYPFNNSSINALNEIREARGQNE